MNLEKMKKANKKAFTLIELLVVITIIGILATGAVAVYTSQIQKARDTTRINDIDSIKASVEQSYGDKSTYPTTVDSGSIGAYMPKIPKDSKAGAPCAKATSGGVQQTLGYGYVNGADTNGVDAQRYEVSTTFENKGNLDNKASKDSGNDNNQLEIGIAGSGGTYDLVTSTGDIIPN